ncbi:KPN_02809 family neutral zinc metallopeptidase [Erythrobacter sp. HA6-11]
MRLGKYDTSNIRVRSGGRGGLPGGRGGGIGCGAIIIAAIAYFVFGADPMQTIGMIEGAQQQAPQQQQANVSEEQVCESGPYAREACNALSSLNSTWRPEFERAGIPFQDPILTLYSGSVTTQGCGSATSAAGPFYCPADMGIYIDTSFYDEMARRMGAGGDFARYYVMAHEYGHHIQNLTGLASQVRSLQARDRSRANQLQVRMELMADCYAGVWAGKNRNLIEPGDMQEGLRAASAIGDDTLMRNAGQRINPENFTHGTSRQRMEALRLGLEGANDSVCDRYFQN